MRLEEAISRCFPFPGFVTNSDPQDMGPGVSERVKNLVSADEIRGRNRRGVSLFNSSAFSASTAGMSIRVEDGPVGVDQGAAFVLTPRSSDGAMAGLAHYIPRTLYAMSFSNPWADIPNDFPWDDLPLPDDFPLPDNPFDPPDDGYDQTRGLGWSTSNFILCCDVDEDDLIVDTYWKQMREIAENDLVVLFIMEYDFGSFVDPNGIALGNLPWFSLYARKKVGRVKGVVFSENSGQQPIHVAGGPSEGVCICTPEKAIFTVPRGFPARHFPGRFGFMPFGGPGVVGDLTDQWNGSDGNLGGQGTNVYDVPRWPDLCVRWGDRAVSVPHNGHVFNDYVDARVGDQSPAQPPTADAYQWHGGVIGMPGPPWGGFVYNGDPRPNFVHWSPFGPLVGWAIFDPFLFMAKARPIIPVHTGNVPVVNFYVENIDDGYYLGSQYRRALLIGGASGNSVLGGLKPLNGWLFHAPFNATEMLRPNQWHFVDNTLWDANPYPGFQYIYPLFLWHLNGTHTYKSGEGLLHSSASVYLAWKGDRINGGQHRSVSWKAGDDY